MTLFPGPDRMTNPGGCRFARAPCANDLVRRFGNFKRGRQKNWHSLPVTANARQGTENRPLRSVNK
ncbi:hypothetical protein E0H38_01120 [Rhizobium leguminosarum bv. viciae]|nr:hypothetical protein [Rhizobium leguminosarum bv. viciae]TBZ26445.1 hypothetical protein E0H38_01120 [Rhizobium leguminosarum bv. viciae]